jgi:hypothetical protein
VAAEGLFDRMLASMRPSLLTALLVLTVGGAFMFGGAGACGCLVGHLGGPGFFSPLFPTHSFLLRPFPTPTAVGGAFMLGGVGACADVWDTLALH